MADTEGTVPEWIGAELAQKALGSPVEAVEVRRALAVGENYGSDMFRVCVTLFNSSTRRSLIIKKLPEGGTGKMLSQAQVFPREISALTKALPCMYAGMNDKQPGKYQPFSAQCLHHDNTPTEFMILEDLCDLGFKNVSRHNGLDLAHCELVIQRLANFHASSVAVSSKYPDIFDRYMEPLYTQEMWDSFTDYLKMSYETLVKELEKFPECHEKYGTRLTKFCENISSFFMEKVKYRPETFNVLVHGDLWVNNIMFKHNEDKVTDLRFVDFQICNYTSPVIDLQYFLQTSANEDVHDKHIDELIELYHTNLTNTLEDLDCGHLAISLDDLKKDFDEYYTHGLNALISVLPIVLADAEAAQEIKESFERFDKGPEEMKPSGSMYSNEYFLKCFMKRLPVFEEKGCFR